MDHFHSVIPKIKHRAACGGFAFGRSSACHFIQILCSNREFTSDRPKTAPITNSPATGHVGTTSDSTMETRKRLLNHSRFISPVTVCQLDVTQFDKLYLPIKM